MASSLKALVKGWAILSCCTSHFVEPCSSTPAYTLHCHQCLCNQDCSQNTAHLAGGWLGGDGSREVFKVVQVHW